MKGRDTNFTNFHEGMNTDSACTDICFFDELEEGDLFYLPFTGNILEKRDGEFFCLPDCAPDIPNTVDGLWLVGRVERMTCRRCGCRESSACHDERLGRPCQWVSAGLCSACLDDQEFGELVAQIEERRLLATVPEHSLRASPTIS